MYRFNILLGLVLLISGSSRRVQADCDQCVFDDSDSDDCTVYGNVQGRLVGWSRASQSCLDRYQIDINPPDPTLICSTVNGFVNSLRNGLLENSSVKYGLGIAAMPPDGFFEEVQSGVAVLPEIRDQITIEGKTYNCTEATGGDEIQCYDAMKQVYFLSEDGKKEMDDVCETLANSVRLALEEEQFTVRIRICTEMVQGFEFNIFPECNPLNDQVEEQMDLLTGDSGCSALGFGPAQIASQIPDECKRSVGGENGGGGDDGDDGDDSGADDDSALSMRMSSQTLVGALMVVLFVVM